MTFWCWDFKYMVFKKSGWKVGTGASHAKDSWGSRYCPHEIWDSMCYPFHLSYILMLINVGWKRCCRHKLHFRDPMKHYDVALTTSRMGIEFRGVRFSLDISSIQFSRTLGLLGWLCLPGGPEVHGWLISGCWYVGFPKDMWCLMSDFVGLCGSKVD